MTSVFCFRKCAWLISMILSNNNKVTLRQINDAYARSSLARIEDREPPTRQTWFNYINYIADAFGIDIECTPKGCYSTYSIINQRDLFDSRTMKWMTDVISHGNDLFDLLCLRRRFRAEKHPSERGWLKVFAQAMRSYKRMNIIYQGYNRTVETSYIIEPYYIIIYKGRHYVLANMANGKKQFFSLDRMVEAEVLETEKFEMDTDLSADEYLENVYGVFLPDNMKVETIIIRAHGIKQKYLRDVPFHCTQREISSCDEYADFEYKLYPTKDFLSDVIQQGGLLEIVSPPHVRNMAKDIILETLSRFT